MFPDQKPKETKKKYTMDIYYSPKSKPVEVINDDMDNNEESFSRF